MPGLQDDSGAVPQSMMEALESFCSLPEQSYEQFLSTFTHLSTENVTAGCLKVPEEENNTCLVELDRRDGVNMDRKVDTEEETEDLHNTKDACVLPGEVEEDLPLYTPAFCHLTQLELSSTDMDHRTHTPPSSTESQSETEEVVPFSLDDTFDYDNVALSHKYPVISSNCGSS
ncbi:intraflagellar transport-associated protein [Pangasianodon hypophthalmus]|uniref:intraflagellar transport-associated protein n=1 Tax=Pangasianodon hypophthalmus TaxID=310915 RepID=UPI00230703A8|nr:intraflagellar transport-associated protein [Pangasianodon hypophthalmus]XP_026775304.3 intraflagellar transport-associated protein [Pangasianodon hypophthalmus]XP_026775305.3 intraflagellar transport-associated protein [Pangasianodon hypophthalmus]XP_034163379.2 intraflagellar transport-associated protein [Pangasianodon hypophthalmus]XP_053093099.1 intraflagellar transport-associated protein [Pangasianodon hypophthalmus]